MDQQDKIAKHHKRHVFVLMVLIFSLLIGGFWLLNRPRPEQNPLDDPKVGFQYYHPKSMPNGFSIKQKYIYGRHEYTYAPRERLEGFGAASLTMGLRTEDNVYSIDEERASNEDRQELAATYSGYDTTSIKPSCMSRNSEAGRRYRLCHWVDYGRIGVFEVKFIEGNTYIDTTFPTTLQQVIPLDELDTYVDSFKKADPKGIELSIDTV